jgi:hypothetical protein
MRRMIWRAADDGYARRVAIEALDYLFKRISEIARANERATSVKQGGDGDRLVGLALDFALIRIVPACDANEISHVFLPASLLSV